MVLNNTTVDTVDAIMRMDALRQEIYLSTLPDEAWRRYRQGMSRTMLMELYPGPLGYDQIVVALTLVLYRFCIHSQYQGWATADTLMAELFNRLGADDDPKFLAWFKDHPYYRVDEDLAKMAGPHMQILTTIMTECLVDDTYATAYLTPMVVIWGAFRDAICTV